MERKYKAVFTEDMKKDYTILIPNMAPIHFRLMQALFKKHGYNVELLNNNGRQVVDTGLKYVHNDTCYPALLTIGQLLDALQSGKYDLNKTAVMITQTGGGCRASNYIHLLRKALIRMGLSHIPVISLNLSGLEKDSSFKLTPKMIYETIGLLAYADMMMILSNQVRPYEITPGQSDKTVDKWVDIISNELLNGTPVSGLKNISHKLRLICKDFANIKTEKREKIKVGIVGEVYAKFSSLANNNLEEFLQSQNCEIMLPGLMGFMIFKVDNRLEDIKLYGGSKLKSFAVKFIINYLTKIETIFVETIKQAHKFTTPSTYAHVKSLVKNIIGYGSKMGEGWFLTGEMLELIDSGYENIVCCQPFGCLPNHIVGKGMIRKICQRNPNANIVPIDYDPGATKVNQENRIKLMLSVARENNVSTAQ
ncbi:MAG: 2-hydroxyacyl-CoA dehydratase [Oscillospiraceae bacterium]|nr:2-hydroxyacyl-CoA dehydratase [Oscillospiraceae bacterium]MBQ9981275.1 2-hydroxyacyl-CoA dehydratase [Oscillospiraceae bacterium]